MYRVDKSEESGEYEEKEKKWKQVKEENKVCMSRRVCRTTRVHVSGAENISKMEMCI